MKSPFVCFGAGLLLLLCPAHEAQSRQKAAVILYSFTGGPDGLQPESTLTADGAGNWYGTTNGGGPYSQGVVFRLAANGIFKVLYAFFGERDGGLPRGGVIFDAAGNLYGTANRGGVNDAGVVFKIAPDGTESTIHRFGKQPGDGEFPVGDLVADAQGNFYGVTGAGGTNRWGTVYEITPTGSEKVLYSFAAGAVDGSPAAGLIRDKHGNLYGPSLGGGGSSGSVFKLAPDGSEGVLYAFTGGDDGSTPLGSLAMDKLGAIYGTAVYAGPDNRGVIFKIAPDGSETTVHSFAGPDGTAPQAGLIRGRKGAFYGTTCSGGRFDEGVAYKLTSDSTVRVLHSFGVQGHGGTGCPSANLAMDGEGNLFGTTAYGGEHLAGSIFEIKK